MEDGFVRWYFDTHYILSTLVTPWWALLWCVYKGLVVRALVCIAWCFPWFCLSMLNVVFKAANKG